MNHIYIICNIEKETERLENLQKVINNSNINENKIDFFCKYWSDDIENIKNNNNHKMIYDNNLFQNLNNAEISLFINHIEILKNIKNKYKNGNFLILESDIFVYRGMQFNDQKLNDIIHASNKLDNWDIINIGGSCYDIFLSQGYPKSNPIIIGNDKYFNEDRLICIEALIWNYNSICKFLDLFEKYNLKNNNQICEPIDVILDNLCKAKDLNLYWKIPCLCKQASGIQFKSWLRK